MVSPSLTLLRTQSDERLTALARVGHERAFEAIVERYRRPLLRHGRRLLPEARAEEAVQQAFIAAWAALERGDDVRHLSGWLHRIVHNTALNALRGERDDHAELREWLDAAAAPEVALERREMLRETLANLAALPERQREALLRVAVDGVSAEEVGSSLGLTEGAVRQLLYRARSALRAAATALTPMPVASWLAQAQPLAAPIAEATAGAGGAGLSALLAKGTVVAVMAGAAVAAPAVIDEHPRSERHARAETAGRSVPAVSAAKSPVALPAATRTPVRGGPATTHSTASETNHRDSRRSDSSGSRESGHGRDSGSDGSGSSGSGSSGSGGSSSSGPGSDGSGSGSSGSGSSGSGSGEAGATESLSSGSGSSGSGSSGSGSSGSGSSGSDDPTLDDAGSGGHGSDDPSSSGPG
jgi:RNA polymerase sigma factor (sigma-70 family)